MVTLYQICFCCFFVFFNFKKRLNIDVYAVHILSFQTVFFPFSVLTILLIYRIKYLNKFLLADIEEQVRTLQQKKNALFQDNGDRVGLGSEGHFDIDIYGSSSSKFEGYVTSIAPNEDQDVSVFFLFFVSLSYIYIYIYIYMHHLLFSFFNHIGGLIFTREIMQSIFNVPLKVC